ncbi:hypothetical protein L6452_17266 [Arctium lappa]|uniref:Uncharacterized protein n=1 Tax=Arctium lappa TaxID=4217 RepID=A0ACB9C2S6_ARCLA|nr:hypothetical protein L6452_17266 [Arctium lappa]
MVPDRSIRDLVVLVALQSADSLQSFKSPLFDFGDLNLNLATACRYDNSLVEFTQIGRTQNDRTRWTSVKGWRKSGGYFIAVKEVFLLDQWWLGRQSVLQLEQEIALLS